MDYNIISVAVQSESVNRMLIHAILDNRNKQVFAKDGIAGFWAGVQPNVARTFLVNAAELGM